MYTYTYVAQDLLWPVNVAAFEQWKINTLDMRGDIAAGDCKVHNNPLFKAHNDQVLIN